MCEAQPWSFSMRREQTRGRPPPSQGHLRAGETDHQQETKNRDKLNTMLKSSKHCEEKQRSLRRAGCGTESIEIGCSGWAQWEDHVGAKTCRVQSRKPKPTVCCETSVIWSGFLQVSHYSENCQLHFSSWDTLL